MTQSQMQKAYRPLAVALAVVFTTAFWLPTVSTPAQAADRSPVKVEAGTHMTIILAAPVAPAMM
ncbi:hypothetical protein WBP07_14255 [Novosphingobium sp. BL-8A]|uniref:hypothetical protein n=1 Tax=Novosphingobium sp. BL-8A TaxID=3127639 RepID=UPI0037583CC8